MGKKKARLSKDTMNAILEAGDKFFEQLGGDLAVVASHAGRKTIDDSDVIAIMQRYGNPRLSLLPSLGPLMLETDKGKSHSERRRFPWPRDICREKH